MLGDSFQAMWEASGGEEGLRPFLADCLQWEGLAKGVGQQLKTSAPMVSISLITDFCGAEWPKIGMECRVEWGGDEVSGSKIHLNPKPPLGARHAVAE